MIDPYILKMLGIVIGWLGIAFHCFIIVELCVQMDKDTGGFYFFLAYCVLLILVSYSSGVKATRAVIQIRR